MIIIIKVLVPLCGKAGCLLYLYKAGHTVVGENVLDWQDDGGDLEFRG